MEAVLRQWTILQYIPKGDHRISSRELLERLRHKQFTVSLRTVQRDLEMLSAVFPITYDGARDKEGWYASADLIQVPGLDPQTALTFKLVEHYLRPLQPSSTIESLMPYFAAAGNVLEALGKDQRPNRHHGAHALRRWLEKVRALPPRLPMQAPEIDPDIQRSVYQAVLDEKQLRVMYHPVWKAPREYVVNPLALVVRDKSVYLVCTLWDYDDIRQLLLHRMQSAEVMPDSHAMTLPGFSIDEYIRQGEFATPQGGTIQLEAVFHHPAARFPRETPLREDQTTEELNDGVVLVRATVVDSAELRVWLLGFGDKVEVLKPEPLRAEFGEMFRELAGRYGAG